MKKIILALLLLSALFIFSACSCEHDWSGAICIAPKTCSLCGETEGESLGHSWRDATCTAPQTCSRCRETEGEPAEHIWSSATCATPKTCSVCGATEGEKLDHTWNDATCSVPKTCSVCGETEDSTLEHISGDWELVETDYVECISIYVKCCTVCGKEIEDTDNPLESLHNGEIFMISPYDFYKRLNQIYREINEDMRVQYGTNGDQFLCGFFVDGSQKGILQFSDDAGSITKDQKNDACFNGIFATISEDITNVLIALVRTCDPSMDFEAARSVAFAIIIDGEAEVNDIIYQCIVNDGGGLIWVDIVK